MFFVAAARHRPSLVVPDLGRAFIAYAVDLVPQSLINDAQVRDVGGDHLIRVALALPPAAGVWIDDGAVCIPDQLTDVEPVAKHAAAALGPANEGLVVPMLA